LPTIRELWLVSKSYVELGCFNRELGPYRRTVLS